MASSEWPEPGLLRYLADYQVVICTECRYAIQPKAVARHFKDIHHMCCNARRGLVEYAAGLQLADTGAVLFPLPDHAPIPLLPTEQGLACEHAGCFHLCVTAKRMKSHWAAAHSASDGGNTSPHWRPVTLQTFFRGNQLRYFVVAAPASETPPGHKYPLEDIALPPSWTSSDLALFIHFTQDTYQTLGRSAQSKRVWRAAVPALALGHDVLKQGVLACAALHIAHLQPTLRRGYVVLAARHHARALAGCRALLAGPSTALSATTRDALLASAHLLAVYCFATDVYAQCDGSTEVSTEVPDLAAWLATLRNSHAVLQFAAASLGAAAAAGKHQNLTRALLEDARGSLPPTGTGTALPAGAPHHAARFAQLLNLLVPLPRRPAYFGALVLLGMAVRALPAPALTPWAAIRLWPARIRGAVGEPPFVTLLRAREPAALVLLAHYCVLLGPLERDGAAEGVCWYMQGCCERVLRAVWRDLEGAEGEWRAWLDWVVVEAGIGGVLLGDAGMEMFE